MLEGRGSASASPTVEATESQIWTGASRRASGANVPHHIARACDEGNPSSKGIGDLTSAIQLGY